MKRLSFATASLLAVLPCSLTAFQGAAEPVELPLSRLTLYSSGVGYFEHAGPIAQDGTVTLDFSAQQLNDVLKSLLVRGARGPVSLSYPGEEPVEKRLAGFGINLAQNTSLATLVQQLRGISIKVTLLGETQPITGRVVGVQDRQRVIGNPPATVTETLVTIATASGIRNVVLDQVETLVIDDPSLQQELDKALSLLGSTRDRDDKPMTITFDQASDLTAVSYLLEMPLWKVSYRLDLGRDDDAPLLQGWAIVDNTTDADWENVAVTLVSGRPVSFVQNLYSPEFLQRPVVQPERFAGLRPREYEQDQVAQRARKDSFGLNYKALQSQAIPAPASPMIAAELMEAGASDGFADFADLASGIDPSAAAGDLGEMFAYTISQPVSLPRGGSAMLPIVNQSVQATPLSIYNINAQRKHPMRGVRLTNSTDLKLDAGPVTVLDDGAYAGDAQLGFLSPGDDRLISYGLDLELTVDASQKHSTQLVTAVIRKGVMELSESSRFEQTYSFRSAAGKDRNVLVEHTRIAGRELVQPKPDSTGIEKTQTLYRFPLGVPAGKTVELTVVETQPYVQTVQLINMDTDQLFAFASDGRFPEHVRKALAAVGDQRRALADTQRAIAEIENSVQEITAEQDRIRRNMGSIDHNSSLYKRYVTKLDEQETTLEESNTKLAELHDQALQQERALSESLEKLTVE